MKKAQVIARIIEKVLLLPALMWIYTPIIAGILITMAYYLPIGFASWWIFSLYGTNWTLSLIIIKSESALVFLLVIEIILFIIGLTLFLWGLIYLSNVKLKKQGLAMGGPYKFIRHPQHLGLILMALVNSLYIPWAVHSYIRIGSILSWSLFSLVLIIVSELEEKKLLKKYGNVYLEYRIKTGMFLPRIFERYRKEKEVKEIKLWRRLGFIFVGYFCFISLIRLLLVIVGIDMWYDYLSRRFWYINLISLGLILLTVGIKIFRDKRFPIEIQKGL